MPAFELEGRSALVAGGGLRIDREITCQLVDLEATVLVMERNQDDLDQMADAHPGKVIGLRTDLSDRSQVDDPFLIQD